MTNMKAASEARIGDTFKSLHSDTLPEPGFEQAKPLVFCGIYPEDPEDYQELQKSIHKLALTDPAVQIAKESSSALGNGFRCGFLGVLHMDVFNQRLDDEYQISTILTTPSVPYRAKLKNGKLIEIQNALLAPDAADVAYYEEPMAKAILMCPPEYFENLYELCNNRRGELQSREIINN